jgi:Leucine-rich repeat (LRR) protein
MKIPDLRKYRKLYNICVLLFVAIFMVNVGFTLVYKEKYRAKSVPGETAIALAVEDNEPDENDSKQVIFKDANFERIVRFNLQVSETNNVVFRDVKKVTDLNLNHLDIKSLDGVESFRSLKKLDLSFNQVSDLTPLTKLTHLEEIILYMNKVVDVSALAKIKTLIKLDLSSNQITDIAPLAVLTNLEELDLNNNKITTIHSVAMLPNLKMLDVSRNYIKDMNTLDTKKYRLILDWGNKN